MLAGKMGWDKERKSVAREMPSWMSEKFRELERSVLNSQNRPAVATHSPLRMDFLKNSLLLSSRILLTFYPSREDNRVFFLYDLRFKSTLCFLLEHSSCSPIIIVFLVTLLISVCCPGLYPYFISHWQEI